MSPHLFPSHEYLPNPVIPQVLQLGSHEVSGICAVLLLVFFSFQAFANPVLLLMAIMTLIVGFRFLAFPFVVVCCTLLIACK